MLFYVFASLCYAAPLTKIGRYGDEMNICMQVAGRIASLLDMDELPQEGAPAVPDRFDVVFDGVSFGLRRPRRSLKGFPSPPRRAR